MKKLARSLAVISSTSGYFLHAWDTRLTLVLNGSLPPIDFGFFVWGEKRRPHTNNIFTNFMHYIHYCIEDSSALVLFITVYTGINCMFIIFCTSISKIFSNLRGLDVRFQRFRPQH